MKKGSTLLGVSLAMSLGGCTLILGDVTATDTAPGTTSDDVTSAGQTVASSGAGSTAGTGGMGAGGGTTTSGIGGMILVGSNSSAGGGSTTSISSASSGAGAGDPCLKMAPQDCENCEIAAHPDGSMVYNTLATCVVCQGCYQSCMGAMQGCPAPNADAGALSSCDSSNPADCGTCEACAQTQLCASSTAACNADPDCIAFANTLQACQ